MKRLFLLIAYCALGSIFIASAASLQNRAITFVAIVAVMGLSPVAYWLADCLGFPKWDVS